MNLKNTFLATLSFLIIGCGENQKSTYPVRSDITESVYSSGQVESLHQYELYTTVNGQIKEIYVQVGDTVKQGDPILRIENDRIQYNYSNATLSKDFYSTSSNREQLQNLKNNIANAKNKKEFDSLQYERQKKLKQEGIGLEVEYESSRLAYETSSINYYNALSQYEEFNRQLKFNFQQAQNNLELTKFNQSEYTVRSAIDGKVYALNYSVGDLIGPQHSLGIIGSANEFILKMLIDEEDILDISVGQTAFIQLDSYRDSIFEAEIVRIYPIMDPKSNSFLIEAVFRHAPHPLYPNLNFEANIFIKTKKNALLIPREYLLNNNSVLLVSGDTVSVITGLKDYKMIEILSGLNESDQIMLPE